MYLFVLCCLFPASDPTLPVSVHDLGRFPPVAVCESQLAWYRQHRDWLAGRQEECLRREDWAGWCYWWDVLHDCDRAREAWRTCQRAQDPEQTEDARVEALHDLLDLLGADAYCAGRMPLLWKWGYMREGP